MRERLQEWATYFGAVGLALWAAAGILFLLGNQPRERLITLLVIGVLFFALYVYARPAQVRAAVTGRGARYGSNALLLSVAFIGIVALLNFLGSRYHVRQDLTANKSFTLSPLTVKVLQDLKQPVQAIAFYTSLGPSNKQEVEDRLKEYANQTDKFTYRFVDPQAEPQIAKEYKVQFDGTLVFERGMRRENALQTDESSITNAILKVSQETQPTIYFTTGHGEHSPDDSGENGYSLMKGAMEAENYKVDLLNLKTVTTTLPSDITALIIAGPRQPFEPPEVQRVKEYLDQSGRAFILIDPQVEAGLDELLNAWGVRLRNDLVFDPKFGFFGQAQVPVISNYPNHAITQDLTGESTFFPGVRSLWTGNVPPPNRTATVLLTTSNASWGETDFNSVKNQDAQFNAEDDARGPLNLAYAVEISGGDKPGRLVVIGNSTFIANGTLNARITVGGQQSRIRSGNALLFGNALHWLAGQENLIAIPPKAPDQYPIFLTGEQSSFVFWSTFLMIPGAILVMGALAWWRRR
jgi:ABC-type uncharacterized transport system involved in gliding motility auxiliary subunit